RPDEEAGRVAAALVLRPAGAQARALLPADLDVAQHLRELRLVALRTLVAARIERVAAHHRFGFRHEARDEGLVQRALNEKTCGLGTLLPFLREHELKGTVDRLVECGA